MTIHSPKRCVAHPSVNAPTTAPTPWAATSTDVDRSSPWNTTVAICETKATNGAPISIVTIINGTIRRMSAFVLAKRKPSLSAPHTGRRVPVEARGAPPARRRSRRGS